MKLDLMGWAEAVTQPTTGEPLMVGLDRITRDPLQPRKEFNEEALQALAASIKASGVLQPISLRPDPDEPGHYIINYGERRYRATGMAGLTEIPALIHKNLSTYDQVVENLHRADLTPMELALFIQARIQAGEKKGEIAARLGHNSAFVTEHLALVEAPACVEKAYASGVKSVRTLYDLRRLHDEFPQQVEAWCASGVEITRKAVLALGEKFSHDEKNQPESGAVQSPETEPAAPAAVAKFSHDEKTEDKITLQAPGDPGPKFSHDEKKAPPAVLPPAEKFSHDEKSPAPPRQNQAATAAPRMVIEVEHDGRKAIVQQTSVIHVLYEGEATSVAIPLSAVNTIKVVSA